MLWYSFVSFDKDEMLRVVITFEKEVEPIANLNSEIGVDVELLLLCVVVIRKLLVALESKMAGSVFDGLGEL